MAEPDLWAQATEAILQSWTALQLMVANGAGGPEGRTKARWLVEAIGQWFGENANLQADEVSDFLEDLIVTEFRVEVADGSYPEVASALLRFHHVCASQPREAVLAQIRQLPRCGDLGQCVTQGEVTEDAVVPVTRIQINGHSGGLLAQLQAEPEPVSLPVDTEAWTTVTTKKKGKPSS